jgi:hypothetical protein
MEADIIRRIVAAKTVRCEMVQSTLVGSMPCHFAGGYRL